MLHFYERINDDDDDDDIYMFVRSLAVFFILSRICVGILLYCILF